MTLQLIASSSDVGYESSYLISSAVIPLLLLIGVLKCLKIARRPRTNAKACYSLAVLLGSWMVLAGAGVVFNSLQEQGHPLGFALFPKAIIGLLGFAGPVLAMVLALWSRAEINREPERYNQGKMQAEWAFTLSLLLIMGWFYGGYRAIQQYTPAGGAARNSAEPPFSLCSPAQGRRTRRSQRRSQLHVRVSRPKLEGS